MSENFPKAIKLKQKRVIDDLFSKGKWQTSGAMRIIFNNSDEFDSPKIGVSASKRNFKKAVDRNRIKRLLRECYRLNKATFHNAFGENVAAMLFWNSKQKPENYHAVLQEFMQLCDKQAKK